MSKQIVRREFCTIPNAAIWWDVATKTVYIWIREGRIPAYRIGPGTLRLRWDDMHALAEEDALKPIDGEDEAAKEVA